MEIVSFDDHRDFMVTLHMRDMPRVAKMDNNYTPPQEEPQGQRPVVRSISVRAVPPGRPAILMGENLQEVNGVGLLVKGKYDVCTNIVAKANSVTFRVSQTARPDKDPYPVCIRTSSYPAFRRTNVTLQITAS